MNDQHISQIVNQAFQKAKEESFLQSKHALSNHISDYIQGSGKTLERAYDRYVTGKNKSHNIGAATVDDLCVFLGYDGYLDYRSKYFGKKPMPPLNLGFWKNVFGNGNWKIIVGLVSTVLFIVLLWKGSLRTMDPVGNLEGYRGCMVWNEKKFEKTDCASGLHPEYQNPIVPFDEARYQNLKKLDSVYTGFGFFSEETERPLVWYAKKSKTEVEFFSAPGVHPVTGKTLKAVTPYIIEKYVPIHDYKANSFVNPK